MAGIPTPITGIPEVNINDVLQLIRPGAIWVLNGTTLTWLDIVQVQPTQLEMTNGYAQFQTNQQAASTSLTNNLATVNGPITVATPDPRLSALIAVLKAKGTI